MADISQTSILKKIQKYLEIQYKKRGKGIYKYDDIQELLFPFDTGHCSGLGGLYLYRKSEGEESIFFGNLSLIAEWDGEEDKLEESPFLVDVFEQTINDVTWLQSESKKMMAYTINQKDLGEAFEIIKPKSKQKERRSLFSKEFEMAFVFKEKELLFALKNIVKEKKMIRLGSTNHTISLMCIDGKYHIYDPNETEYNQALKSNEVVLDSMEAVAAYVKKGLFGFAPKGKNCNNMPIEIQVYDKEGNKPAEYKYSPEEIVDKCLKENNEKNRKNDYDKYDAITFALQRGNTQMVDHYISIGMKIPEYFFDLKGEYFEPLTCAVMYNDVNLLRILLKNKPEWVKTKGTDILQLAIKQRKYDLARYLIVEKGVKLDQNLADSLYISQVNDFLGYKHKSYDVQLLQIFSLAKVKLEKLANLYGKEWLPMNAAVIKGDHESVQFLLDKGFEFTKEHYELAKEHKQNKLLKYFKEEILGEKPAQTLFLLKPKEQSTFKLEKPILQENKGKIENDFLQTFKIAQRKKDVKRKSLAPLLPLVLKEKSKTKEKEKEKIKGKENAKAKRKEEKPSKELLKYFENNHSHKRKDRKTEELKVKDHRTEAHKIEVSKTKDQKIKTYKISEPKIKESKIKDQKMKAYKLHVLKTKEPKPKTVKAKKTKTEKKSKD